MTIFAAFLSHFQQFLSILLKNDYCYHDPPMFLRIQTYLHEVLDTELKRMIRVPLPSLYIMKEHRTF